MSVSLYTLVYIQEWNQYTEDIPIKGTIGADSVYVFPMAVLQQKKKVC